MTKPLTDAEIDDLLRVRRDQPHRGTGFLLDRALASIVALRAALATQPQPLFEGTAKGFYDRIYTLVGPRDRLVVYPATAGSATPTQDPETEIDAGDGSYRTWAGG